MKVDYSQKPFSEVNVGEKFLLLMKLKHGYGNTNTYTQAHIETKCKKHQRSRKNNWSMDFLLKQTTRNYFLSLITMFF